jgi:predicted NodU family carbamoyl transferase
MNYDELAGLLAKGQVVAWVQGRSEVGPRALGNRSIIAAPFQREITDRLNWIKQREWYRPIAPICLEDEGEKLFGCSESSPYMLFFHRVRDEKLAAVTHVDGSARVQTVSRTQNEPMFELLMAFKRLTGYGVLCNTSLNLKGKGFINRSSDLFGFASARKIDAVVVERRLFRPIQSNGK